jgi:hypothetical protein
MIPPLNKIRILRLIHINNLAILLSRKGLHAPRFTPDDGLQYKTIHNIDIQNKRNVRLIPCGPKGTIHDYVPFYFGPLSPMMLNLKTGRVPTYNEGQEPLTYLVSNVANIVENGHRFVFSNGHGIAFNTDWYDDVADLDKVDWGMVYERYWADDYEKDMDRQRRKQAEFLVHHFCPWDTIVGIVVIDEQMKSNVEQIFANCDTALTRPIAVKRDWYY